MKLEEFLIVGAFILLVVICAVQNQLAYEQQEAYKVEFEEHQEMVKEAQGRTEEALDMVDTWEAGYKGLQEEHSQALEYIEQLEYELEWRE